MVVPIKHASELPHLEEHNEHFDYYRKNMLLTGKKLWENKEQLFPFLIFCECVREQLLPFKFSHPIFRQIVKRLEELNTYFSNWSIGNFDSNGLVHTTLDSAETMRRFSDDRTFLCPDGQKRVFSWHRRMTPGAWRLYFFPDSESKKAIIGYIGLKLPTVEDQKVYLKKRTID